MTIFIKTKTPSLKFSYIFSPSTAYQNEMLALSSERFPRAPQVIIWPILLVSGVPLLFISL